MGLVIPCDQKRCISVLRGHRARSALLLKVRIHDEQRVIQPRYPPVPLAQEVYLVKRGLLRADLVQQFLHLELEFPYLVRDHSFEMMRVQKQIPFGNLPSHGESAAAHKISHLRPLF